MTLFSGNWRRRLLVGGALYLLYALVALAFLTGVAGKRVVAAPVFAPYLASPPPAAVKTKLTRALAPLPARHPGLRLPDLQTLKPYDIHTVGSPSGGDLRLKFGTTIWNAGPGPLETRG